MRDPTQPQPPTRARVGLLAGGLALVVAGVAVLAFVLASAAGLVGRDDPPAMADPGAPPTTAPGASAGSEPATVAYRLEPATGAARTVRLEVAADPAARARGLMGRRQVPEGTGMVFLYPSDVAEAYWMKNTLVPLSIAFVAADGRVVSVAEMTPCKADPCPSYPPAGPYRYAVELAAGSFGEAGIGPGAKVVPVDPAALPEPA
ncbi:MAG TPA: DUF192 domain-containing protein [Actinomycetota bacterium]|nr:DUF192 domain-containing protein [Actinomycetota bacterium]